MQGRLIYSSALAEKGQMINFTLEDWEYGPQRETTNSVAHQDREQYEIITY